MTDANESGKIEELRCLIVQGLEMADQLALRDVAIRLDSALAQLDGFGKTSPTPP